VGTVISDRLSDAAIYLDMAKTIKAKPSALDKGRTLRLWIGLLLPPIAWSVQLQSLYLTSEYGCYTSDFTWNHVVVIVALVFSLLGWAIAGREWSASGRGTADDGGDGMSRGRFMATLGLLSGALFSIVIFAQWLPTLMGVPCDK